MAFRAIFDSQRFKKSWDSLNLVWEAIMDSWRYAIDNIKLNKYPYMFIWCDHNVGLISCWSQTIWDYQQWTSLSWFENMTRFRKNSRKLVQGYCWRLVGLWTYPQEFKVYCWRQTPNNLNIVNVLFPLSERIILIKSTISFLCNHSLVIEAPLSVLPCEVLLEIENYNLLETLSNWSTSISLQTFPLWKNGFAISWRLEFI